MKKKEKAKPRTQVYGSSLKERTFNYYIKEMEEDTKEYNKCLHIQNNFDDVNFYLFQTINNQEKMRDMLFELAYFYDKSFVGNKDFMHIPNISQITENVLNYPVMIASKKDSLGNECIIGATTVKMENNSSITDNPYFPTKNENVLSITGVLSKGNACFNDGTKVRGIGKQLFKTSIKGAYSINKNENIRLICEIDCRNKNSLYSISKAVKELNMEGIPIQLGIGGYYEVLDKKNQLVEAPTFVLEVDLSGNKDINKQVKIFDYTECGSVSNELNQKLLEVIKNNTKEYKRFVNTKDKRTIIYHKIKTIDALNVLLNVGNTAENNERFPVLQNLQPEYV